MKHTHIRHLAAIAVAAQLAMSASAAPIDNYTDLADAVANAATGDTIKLKAGTINVTSTITITKGITLSGNRIERIYGGYDIDLRWCETYKADVPDHNSGNRIFNNQTTGKVRFETQRP